MLSTPLLIAEQSMSENEDEILGIWLNAQQDGFIRIYKKTNKFEGIIEGSPNPEDSERVDSNNPDPKLRRQLLTGMVMLHGFSFDGSNKWMGGQIYDPNNGKTYKCELELIDNQKLSVRGYMGIPLFGRTDVWTRKQ